MVFNELREAIVTRLKEAMPKEVDVAGHPGVIDTAELGRLCMAAPALRVSVLKVLGVDRARGNDAAELQIGVYIVAGAGKGGVGADEVALALLPRVLAVINGENWNLQCVETGPKTSAPTTCSTVRSPGFPAAASSRSGASHGGSASSCRRSSILRLRIGIRPIPTPERFPRRGTIRSRSSCGSGSGSKPCRTKPAHRISTPTTSSP